ncbi:hypothetical protein [Sphingomonas sp.]|jgi:hypothetical protein|nr:hypothetical protein [Sphingomonas sp.]
MSIDWCSAHQKAARQSKAFACASSFMTDGLHAVGSAVFAGA